MKLEAQIVKVEYETGKSNWFFERICLTFICDEYDEFLTLSRSEWELQGCE